MIALPLLVSLSLLPFTLAQSDNSTALQIAAIEAHFEQSKIVPDLLASFTPSALLTVNFAGVGDISPGQPLTEQQAATEPTVTVTPANSSVSLNGTYTIMMVDANVVGSDDALGVNHHWLVNGDTIINGTVSNASATAITSYAGPGPAAGSGPHRYVIILFDQPSSFVAPPGFTQPLGVSLFNLTTYVTSSNLGPIVAATYLTVQNGADNSSIPTTSAVVSSTLLPPSPTGGSNSGSGSGSSGPKPTNTNGATAIYDFSPVFAIMGAVLIVLAA